MPDLPLPDAFEWTRFPWGQALRCRALAGLADHCFTTRVPELTRGPAAPGDGWHQVALAMGVAPRTIVRLRQVHGTGVVVVRRGAVTPPDGPDWGTADIALCDDPGAALCAQVADCVPVLLADRPTGAVAAVHAGWRGTAAGTAAVAVESLVSVFGVDPRRLVAAIGPSIGPCCYRVGADVRDVFEASGRWGNLLDAWFRARPAVEARRGIPGTDPAAAEGRPSMFLDTWTANADQLERTGIPAAQIHVAGLCTSCHRDIFHSYRVDGNRAGRMIGIIRSSGTCSAEADVVRDFSVSTGLLPAAAR
jgi:polyphenol oxidase